MKNNVPRGEQYRRNVTNALLLIHEDRKLLFFYFCLLVEKGHGLRKNITYGTCVTVTNVAYVHLSSLCLLTSIRVPK